MSSDDVRRALRDVDGPDFYLATLAVHQEAAQIRALADAIRVLKAERVKLIELDVLDAADAAEMVRLAGGDQASLEPARYTFGADPEGSSR